MNWNNAKLIVALVVGIAIGAGGAWGSRLRMGLRWRLWKDTQRL